MKRELRGIEATVAGALASAGVRKVIAGVSGGADSTLLLLALQRAGAEVTAVHCNFNLRGAESLRDRDFTISLCRRLGITLEVAEFDTETYRREHRLSLEEACRRLRYDLFFKLMEERGCDRVAVAHNADDNAETLLLNLMRGSGVAGLRGMLPDTGRIIRPLLGTTRAEILEYLAENGMDYVTDSSNLTSDYRRNFLRNEVIPLLRTRWLNATASICRTAEIMRQEELMLDDAERRLIPEPEKGILPYRAIRSCPSPEWLIRRFILRFGGDAEIAREIAHAISREDFISGKIWILPSGRISAEREFLEFIPDAESGSTVEMRREVLGNGAKLMERIRNERDNRRLWLPEGIEVRFRHPQPGDRIEPIGMQGSMKVSKIMKDARLSLREKELTAVAVADIEGKETVIWVEGLKRSRHFLISETDAKCVVYYIERSETMKI